ncbi:hypothetical protein EMCRGX_G025684 [Ephydatia muelleri]
MSGPKISGRTVFFEIIGPGGPKFSTKILVRDQIFQDPNSSDRLQHIRKCNVVIQMPSAPEMGQEIWKVHFLLKSMTHVTTTYAERLEHFFKANNVAEEKKKDTLLASIGGKTFTLLRSLTAPGKPGDKQYGELVGKHLKPKPIVISERFRFFKRDQWEGESIKQYAAELQKLTEHCNFGPALNEALRDRLICGMRNQTVQKHLRVKTDLDFAKALEIAEMEEMAMKDASELQLQAKPEPVHYIEKPARTANGTRSKDHKSIPKEIRCWVCGKSGHIAKMCKNKRWVQGSPFQQSRNRQAHAISEESESHSDSEVTGYIKVVTWLRVDLLRKTRGNKPMLITVAMKGKGLEMEVDTGAAVSILPYREYKEASTTRH